MGAYGEEVASKMLQRKGFKILHRNWRCGRPEIDIVALEGTLLVFVEVKTRRNLARGAPEEAVHFAKQQQLIFAAQRFLEQYPHQGEWRFDVVTVLLPERGQPLLTHIRGAFCPSA